MTRSWLTASLLLTLTLAGVGATTAEAQSSSADNLLVEIAPATVDVALGESVDITVSVTNRGSNATGPLAVHIDITDPSCSACT